MKGTTPWLSAPPAPAGVDRRARLVLAALALAVVAISAAYLTLGVRGGWAYVLPRRATTVATLLLVATAVGIATVLFHTITDNHILTPSVMGLDSLYLLTQADKSGGLPPEARAKLNSKNLDMIVANDVSRTDAGFEVDNNAVTFIPAHGEAMALPLMSKDDVAERLVKWIEARRK